jgi:hypothetical protein
MKTKSELQNVHGSRKVMINLAIFLVKNSIFHFDGGNLEGVCSIMTFLFDHILWLCGVLDIT